MNKRTDWFLNQRFGMFIHWGIYAIPARGEWIKQQERITHEEYDKYFQEFDPYRYDPKKWAQIAKAAGMKYVVLTSKHHDGFCLFDSKYTDYKATNTKTKRDLIKEYVEAFREEGIKIGFYYSLLDWHHPDYPHCSDSIHPMRGREEYKDDQRDFKKYVEYLHNQVEELLTNYGKIDIIWFDFSYGEMSGEKWEATKLIEKVRKLQPDIIIDNRLGGDLKQENPPVYSGDFASPEQIIPPEGVTNVKGELVPWEACITLNNNWGYAAADRDYKSPGQVIKALVECVSKGGNMLLNVGPDAKGLIPDESVQILEVVGKWMEKNGDSIYGCGKSSLDKPEWGRYTQNGKKLYAHIYERGIGPINFRGLAGKIKQARLLRDNSEIKIEVPWNAGEFGGDAFINIGGQKLPDEIDTVVELTLY